jgi:hypothetical protein
MSNTQRTLRELRDRGFAAAVVEKWNSFAKRGGSGQDGGGPFGVRQDLFGIVDILVLDLARGFVGVQVCSVGTQAAHIRKLTETCAGASLRWLDTPGGFLEVWAWSKKKLFRGSKRSVWKATVTQISKDMIEGENHGDVGCGMPESGGEMVGEEENSGARGAGGADE